MGFIVLVALICFYGRGGGCLTVASCRRRRVNRFLFDQAAGQRDGVQRPGQEATGRHSSRPCPADWEREVKARAQV